MASWIRQEAIERWYAGRRAGVKASTEPVAPAAALAAEVR
jgi:hypothetical protein